MSYEVPGFKLGTCTAEADLRTSQFLCVTVSGVNQVGLAIAASLAIGVLQNKPNTGEAAEVMCSGVTKAVAGAAITAGAAIGADATSRVISAPTNPIGIALETATAAGQIIAVLLRPTT